MVRRTLLVLLVSMLVGACGVSAGPAAAPSAAPVPPLVAASQLQQWSSWTMLPVAGRGHCADGPEFGSGLWFLAAPSGPTTAYWSCAVPAGASILVVAASLSGRTLPMCSREYSEQAGVDGSASLDGTPVALRWLGPVDAVEGSRPRTPPAHICALTGITVPMTSGHHTLIVQHIRSRLIGTATVDIDAS